MRRILILLAAMSIPFAVAQSASASHGADIDGRAIVTFYDAEGEPIGTAGTTADLEAAAAVEVVTPDGTVRTFDVSAAAETVADMTVAHGGEEVSLAAVLAEVAANVDADASAEIGPASGGDGEAPEEGGEVDAEVDAEGDAESGATVDVDVDEEAGTTTRTITTPAGVVVRIVQSAGAATEVTVDRPDAPESEAPDEPRPDEPSEAPSGDDEPEESDPEAEGPDAAVAVDVGARIDLGIGGSEE